MDDNNRSTTVFGLTCAVKLPPSAISTDISIGAPSCIQSHCQGTRFSCNLSLVSALISEPHNEKTGF